MQRPMVFAVCGLALAGVILYAQTPAPPASPPQTPPVFRAGIDLVHTDVLVLDRDRRPVRGLKASDFTVNESGKPQPIEAFAEIEVAAPSTTGAAWTRDVGSDVVSNDVQTRRLVMVVMDDGYMGVDKGESKSAREIALSAIDQLGPDDLAAVIFTDLGRFQNFTADRVQLRAAVDSFRPRNYGPAAGPPLRCLGRAGGAGCQVNALTRAAEALRDAPAGRKILFFISSGVTLKFSNPEGGMMLPQVRDMLQALQFANISVNTLDPMGLHRGSRSVDESEVDLAAATGGRRIVSTNAPEALVPAIFQENSSYYLIGYRSTNTGTGFRRIQVKVDRPGITVRARNGYFGTRTRASTKPAPAPIDTALTRGVPTGDLPLHIGVATFAVPGRRESEVVLVSRLVETIGERPSPRRVSLITAAFDTGWKSRGLYRQTVEVTPATTAAGSALEYEVQSRLPLAPGRYEIRVAAETGGRAGSAFVSIDVPDFAKERLSASSLVMSRSPAVLQGGKNLLAGLVPLVPTTVRAFGRRDAVEAFVRVHQGGKDRLGTVEVSTRIVDATDRAVLDSRSTFAPERFARDRAADVRLSLPLAELAPGEYLLTIDAQQDKRRVARQARFTVR